MAKRVGIRVEGLNETLRAFRRMPADASKAIRVQSYEIAQHVARDASGGFVTAQARPLIDAIKPQNDRVPTIAFGGNASSGLSGGAKLGDLIGANFGSIRYKQFPPKRRPDYYIYAAIQRDGHYIIETWTKAVDDIARDFEAAV
jgi:hypothetical protein